MTSHSTEKLVHEVKIAEMVDPSFSVFWLMNPWIKFEIPKTYENACCCMDRFGNNIVILICHLIILLEVHANGYGFI